MSTTTMAAPKPPPLPPPSPQEIHRRLSVHAKPKQQQQQSRIGASLSGAESDSDSQLFNDVSPHSPKAGGSHFASSSHQPPLQSIAERSLISGDESDEDDEEGAWGRVAADRSRVVGQDEVAVKSGYLWKKGTRRKTWKKRWFVLRSPHLAYYKTSAEYKLLRLLDMNEVHSVTPVALKKHENTFGLVLPDRTLYLRAEPPEEVESWVRAMNQVREQLQSTTSIIPVPTPPIPIPQHPQGGSFGRRDGGDEFSRSPSAPAITSSDEEDLGGGAISSTSPSFARTFSNATGVGVSGVGSGSAHDPTKIVLSGYLMKCGKRKSWRKRWFVLTGEKLTYCGNHMDQKHQREIPLSQVLDAMESPLPTRHGLGQISSSATTSHTPEDRGDSSNGEKHTFKVVTTKRSLLLCAPSEEEEIRWLSTVRALIARRSGRNELGSGGSQPGAGSQPQPPQPSAHLNHQPPPSHQQQQQQHQQPQRRRGSSINGE